MDLETVILKKEEHIATIMLNRPDRLNALNHQLIQDLHTALQDVAQDRDVRVMVLTGAGRGFCSGADLKEGEGPIKSTPGEALFGGASPNAIREGLRQGVQMMVRGITDLAVPTIAMVNGAAVGAGFDLALACDMRVGSENARMRVAFTALGIVPGTGATWLLPRIVGLPKACELIFTADFIDGQLAKELGIFNHLAPADQVESVTMELARKIAKGPPIAMKLDKMLIHKGMQMSIESALEMIAGCAPIGLTSEDHAEGVKAFIEKREPDFKGK